MSSFEIEGTFGPTFQFTSLSQSDRQDIVLLTADANLPGRLPVTANDFELSALGATTDLLGQWDYPAAPPSGDPHISLVSWRHIAVTGRDIYVRLAHRGYLFPLGHQAVIVKVIERVVVPDPVKGDYPEAYLQIQQYIRVLQPIKSYPAPGQPFGTNDWPFTSVRILTTVSPLLDKPYDKATAPDDNPPLGPAPGGSPSTYAQVFLPTSGGSPVLWDVVATDLAANELHLKLPLYFFNAADTGYPVVEFDVGSVEPFVDAYNQAPAANRQCSGNGARVQMAPDAGGPPGGTTHPVVSLTLAAASTTADPNVPQAGHAYPPAPSSSVLGAADQPAFYPVLSEIGVRLPAADALSRGSFSDSSGNGVVLQYYPGYVAEGFPGGKAPASNKGAVYAQFKDAVSSGTPPLLRFPSDAVGGLGSPNGHMLGMSATAGPVGGDPTSASAARGSLDNYANSGKQAAADYFKQISGEAQAALAQLLGGLPLAGIIKQFASDLPGGAPNITSSLDEHTGVLTVHYNLVADLGSWPSPSDPQGALGTIFEPNPGGGGQFNLSATVTVAPDGTATYDVTGSIDPFNLYLFGNGTGAYVIFVPFNSLTFSAQNGQKPKVQVAIGGSPGPDNAVSFEGPLSFVNTLQQFLSELGGDGLSVNVSPSGVDAALSLSLPPIGMGVFSLSNISLSAGLDIPFLGGPAVATFGFASQDNPFQLTVCMFGGGGFFLIGLGFGGIQQIQAAFQFEGSFQLDVVVATGGVTLAAGVYYAYTAPTTPGTAGSTTISGYVRLTGELSVLGLISISAELDLVLTYQSPNSVAGTASLTVTINLCFFSVSPTITVSKQFSGGSGDPPGPGTAGAVARPAPTEALRAARVAGTGERAGQVTKKLPGPAKPVQRILFKDIVPDQGTWDSYISAFSG